MTITLSNKVVGLVFGICVLLYAAQAVTECNLCFLASDCASANCATCQDGGQLKCINGLCLCVPADCTSTPGSCPMGIPLYCTFLRHTCDPCKCNDGIIPNCVNNACVCPDANCCPPLCAQCTGGVKAGG